MKGQAKLNRKEEDSQNRPRGKCLLSQSLRRTCVSLSPSPWEDLRHVPSKKRGECTLKVQKYSSSNWWTLDPLKWRIFWSCYLGAFSDSEESIIFSALQSTPHYPLAFIGSLPISTVDEGGNGMQTGPAVCMTCCSILMLVLMIEKALYLLHVWSKTLSQEHIKN